MFFLWYRTFFVNIVILALFPTRKYLYQQDQQSENNDWCQQTSSAKNKICLQHTMLWATCSLW